MSFLEKVEETRTSTREKTFLTVFSKPHAVTPPNPEISQQRPTTSTSRHPLCSLSLSLFLIFAPPYHFRRAAPRCVRRILNTEAVLSSPLSPGEWLDLCGGHPRRCLDAQQMCLGRSRDQARAEEHHHPGWPMGGRWVPSKGCSARLVQGRDWVVDGVFGVMFH